MYVRTKKIHGSYYNYLVESVREGKKVVQKHIKYLGKTPFPYTPKIKYVAEYNERNNHYQIFAEANGRRMEIHAFEKNNWESEKANTDFVNSILSINYGKDFVKELWKQNYAIEGTFESSQFLKGVLLDERQEARDAYRYYVMGEYQKINTSYRHDTGIDKLDVTKLKNLDKFCETFSMNKNTTLYRGTRNKHVPDLKVGDTFTDKGFCSTSDDAKVAGAYNRGVLFKINAKKGTLYGAGDYVSKEYILPRGTSFKVKKITKGRVDNPNLDKHSDNANWYTLIEVDIMGGEYSGKKRK